MAGDWLKVETSTPDKPEVYAIADRLGMTNEEAFGRLFRVWRWFDSQSRDGHARVTSLSAIDAEARRPGFGQAMAEVGWLVPVPGGLSLPNFDRHNGKSAKTRALAKDRKSTQRSRDSHADGVTREEKRIKPSPSLRSGEGRRARKRQEKLPLPEKFGLSTRVIEWAQAKGYDQLQAHLDAFKLKAVANDYRYVDWDAALMNAISADWAGIRARPGQSRHQPQAPVKPWKPGGEPDEVLKAAARKLQLEPWQPGETHGMFRARIVEAPGGEELLRPMKAVA